MFEARRPKGWLFLLLLVVAASAQTVTTTTISDTVYRADGTPAGGTLLISWPEFTTAAQQAVAAGNTSIILGAGGALSVNLVSNANATPANTVYTVVYQLDDGTVKTEYWIVPTSSPTTISAVRTTLGATSSASQMATEQYVNTALAGKANDAAVVHLAGPETIVGAKQFTVSPAMPTPVNPTDAANKAYVDNSTQNVGSGSYVSTAGGTMTGPLTLSGNPVAPNQAATMGYVDTGFESKADLLAGLVPTGELGTGTANNTLCLHGDSSWGECGSSSNAVSIQNVPVATTAPTNNQVMTYVASAGEYEPEAGGGVTAGMQAVKYATDFNWTQSPASNLTTAGPQTVNLAVCAVGVTGTEPWYYIYISGTGTAEAVLVTGGTCTGNGQAGSLQFTTLNSHTSGYAISSASGGFQEALIAARFVASNPSGPSQSGKVIVPPGELQVYARVSVRTSNVTVDFSGSIIDCNMADSCIFAGDPSNSTAFLDITLLNPRGRPMVVGGQNAFIEVNAQKTRLLNVTTRIPPTGGTFSSYVQVDNDQSFLLDGLDTALATGSSDYGVLCNASVCNPVIYAPGPFSSNAAVGWLKHLNISLQCSGNGIDWQSGNTVKISDSVIEGFAQYGVRAGIQRGGYGGFELDNVYEEVGSCANPAGAIGQAGVIAQGATVKIGGAELPAGSVPQYANTGSTDYRYYIVANSTTYGASNPFYAGYALTNGSGNITVTTPDVAGATSFDLLRVTYLAPNNPREQAPYGTGSYAVATGVTRVSACANGVCTFTDTQAALQSYTVATPAYFPLLNFWPGNLVLAGNVDSGSVLNAAKAWVQSAPSDIVGVQGTAAPAVVSTECQAVDDWTPLWLSCYTSMAPSDFYDQGAFVLAVKPNNDGGLLTNLKGRLNFPTLGTGPGHIITLSDSNFQKTIATANNRPSNDANDAFIGYDRGNGNPATVGISLGAPVSVSNYIGNVGDGTSWLERLTSGLKEFKTNVQLDNALTVAGSAQASSFLATGAGSWAVQGSYGGLTPPVVGQSAIGFGTGGQLEVSENGSAVVGVAVLDSNGMVSENANTATQLAETPAQCNGSFATGVQANGNANCSIADVLELAETSPPNGIPNYGIFWFDSTCHCPKVISNDGQAVQLGLLNVFNLDANTLEEYNGANPQTLNVYGTRTDASDYQRIRLSYDTADNYFFVGADVAGTGTVPPPPGLGFWLQGSLRWVIDSGFNLKPWSDNVKDIGTPTLRPKHLYAGTYVDTTEGAVATDLPNSATTGTTLSKLAKVTGSPATAIIASTSDTSGMIGVVVDGAGTTGNVQIARGGQASCVFDGATAAGDYVQISSTVGGDCHDAGASYPGIGQILGRVLSTNTGAGTFAMLVAGGEIQAPIAGAVNTVFGRAGTIAAQTGDYSVGQITGAAALASPAFTGAPTVPTPATNDNSTKIATTAWAQNNLSSYAGQTITGTDCSESAGSTADQQINSCIGTAVGGIANAHAITGVQTVSGAMVPGGNPRGKLLLGNTTYWMTSTALPIVIPTHFQVEGNGDATQSVDYNTVIRACNGETTGTPCGGLSYPANTPMVCMGINGICGGAANGNTGQGFNAWIKNVKIDCDGVSGCIAYQNKSFQENSGIYDSTVVNWGNGGRGLLITGELVPAWAASTAYGANYLVIPPPTSNGHYYKNTAASCTSGTPVPTWSTSGGNVTDGTCTWLDEGTSIPSVAPGNSSYSRLIVQNAKSMTCTAGAVGIFVNDPTSSGSPKSIDTVTINNPGCSSTTPTDDMRISTGGHVTQVSVRDIHTETATNGITVGGDSAAQGVTLDGIGAATSYQVNISNAYASGSIQVRNVIGCCHLINDQINGNSIASSSESGGLGMYYLGPPGSGVLLSSAATVPSKFGNIVSATTPATSDNSTKLATTAWVNAQGFGAGSGNVAGPGSDTNGDFACFSGTNGKTLADCGVAPAALAPLASPTFTGTPTVPGYATLASPALTGTPTAQTQSSSDSSTDIATDAFVKNQAYAPLASPTFTGTPTAPTVSAGDNSTKLATTAYVRGEAQMTFTCPVAGAGALVQYCNWTLPAAITVTGFDLAAGTAPVGCSPYATVQVWDGTAGAEVGSYSIPMTSGNNFYPQVTGSTNVSAGHFLRVKVTTGAVSCSTVAAGIVATVTYQMQN